MEKSKSVIKFSNKTVKSVLISVATGEVVTFACLFVASLMMTKSGLSLGMADTVAVICAALGAFAAGFTSGLLIKERGFMYGMMCGILLCVIMVVLAAFTSGFSGGSTTIIKLVLMLLLSTLGAILGVNKKPKRIKF